MQVWVRVILREEDVLAKVDEAKGNKEDVNTIWKGLKDIK